MFIIMLTISHSLSNMSAEQINQLYAQVRIMFGVFQSAKQRAQQLDQSLKTNAETAEEKDVQADRLELKIKVLHNKLRLEGSSENISNMVATHTATVESLRNDIALLEETRKLLLENHRVAKEQFQAHRDGFVGRHVTLISALESDAPHVKEDLHPKLQAYRHGDDFFWKAIYPDHLDNQLWEYLYRDVEVYPEYPNDHMEYYTSFFEYADPEEVEQFLADDKNHYRQLFGDDAGRIHNIE